MNVFTLMGSMRKEGETAFYVNHILDLIRENRPELNCETINISDINIEPCRVVCSSFCSKNPFQCCLEDDLGMILNQMVNADALLIGTPLYFRAPPAKFQVLIERLISVFYYYESHGEGTLPPPVLDKPCGLVGVAEYSNPHVMLEYLSDFCDVLKMNPVKLKHFPYLGVAGQGRDRNHREFHSLDRCRELAKSIIDAVESK